MYESISEIYSDNRESLFVKSLALCFLQLYFQYILKVPSMKDFHPKEPQEVLDKIVFLLLDY